MAVGHLDLTIYKSTDFTIDLEFTDADGDIIVLTASTVVAKLRLTPSASASVSFTVAIDPESEVSPLGDNKVRLSLTDTQTAALIAGKYYWDILETVSSVSQKLMSGRATVLEAISR